MFEHDKNEIQEAWIEAIDAIDPKRKAIAYERACKTVGIETEWVDGVLHIYNDEEESEELLDEFAAELRKMAMDDALRELIDEGMIEARVAENGQLEYALTEEGKLHVEEDLLD